MLKYTDVELEKLVQDGALTRIEDPEAEHD